MQFIYEYKRYIYDIVENFSFAVEANSIKEAICKIVIEHHSIEGNNNSERMKNADSFVMSKYGEKWGGIEVLDSINPLGSSDNALYRISKIYQR